MSLHVLAIASSYPTSPSDGTAPFIRAISHGLVEHGITIDLVLPNHPRLNWPNGDGPVGLHCFNYAPRNCEPCHVWGYARGLRDDQQLKFRTLLAAPTALCSSTLRLCRLIRQLQPDVLHAHWAIPNGVVAALAARYSRLPLVVSVHGSDIAVGERNTFLRTAIRFVLNEATCVTACSGDLAERSIALGAREQSVDVIPYGVDTRAIQPGTDLHRRRLRDILGIPQASTIALAVGRCVAKKGFDRLLLAIARTIEPVHLVLAGDGGLLPALQSQARSLGLGSHVHFMGRVDRDQLKALLHGADLMVVPSVRDSSGNVDGLPNVLLEGMAAGLPIVASDIAGIPEVIQHGTSGLLVSPGDENSLARGIDRLVQDDQLRTRLGKEARHKVRNELSWSTITGRYRGVLATACISGRDQ